MLSPAFLCRFAIMSKDLEKLKQLLKDVNKRHGDGTVMSLKDKPLNGIEVIPSGSLTLDLALGVGGYPKGRIIEAYGPESSGKTTIALHAIAEAQKQGGIAAFIDAEHAFDEKYAESLGVNLKELIFCQPSSAEQALQVADELVSSGQVAIVVIDSVAALVPQAEAEGNVGDIKMGLQARLMSSSLRKLAGPVAKNNAILFFINQTREKIGVMYGSPITTSGGNSLKFYASIRMDVSKSIAKQGDEAYGNKTKVKVVKSKVSSPFGIAEFDIRWGAGIDKVGELVDLGIEKGFIQKGGSWLTYGETKVQGRDSMRQLLLDNPEFANEIEIKIKEKINAEA